MAIKLDMLKCFVTVAQHGGLSSAARKLGRTPSAVSMMLKQFEDHIGSPLFETARKSHLTTLGELIYQEAQREVSHFENTVSVIEGIARSEIGYLRLAVTPSVANVVLPPVIHTFSASHPKVQIDIRDMDSAAIIRALSKSRADIGIGTLPDIEGLERHALFSDAFGVVCRVDAQLAKDWDSLTWSDLKDQTLISNGLCDMITDPDFAPILANSRLRVPSTASLLSLVREGIGITVLPRMAVSNVSSDITFLPLIDAKARRTVSMLTPTPTLMMPVARAFVRCLQDLNISPTDLMAT